MRALILTSLIQFFLVSAVFSQNMPEMVDIGIFTGDNITSISFTTTSGSYQVIDNQNNILLTIKHHNTLIFKVNPSGVNILRNDTLIYTRETVYLKGASFSNSFMITPLNSNLRYRIYDGNLLLSRKGNILRIINRVPFESYVAGTVQSESGFNRHNVFYQVQAIIIRTYALKNINRHLAEGLHLCDKVHCQAYYGKTINQDIILAVEQTRGEVVTDENSVLLNTVYHANCGGETVNSEDLWVQALPYLRSDIDTFCLAMPGAVWEANIPVRNFRAFLTSAYGTNPSQELLDDFSRFRQDSRLHHLDLGKQVHLSRVRQHFALRSTFFNVSLSGDTLYLKGRGYGHGVGLCQEGAMERARHGYSREQILKFYYKGARIMALEPVVIFE
jgi:stage II sporulation protein D